MRDGPRYDINAIRDHARIGSSGGRKAIIVRADPGRVGSEPDSGLPHRRPAGDQPPWLAQTTGNRLACHAVPVT
ncbi:hypothetical protein Raf01_68590 [Rugosimonospora africana]|uniref:Uncharacterized protein n=1 Tax=Rugosimonospora africana TaxID=556532 RepID=A0A8J3VTR0_9ACTN|nr:hypothetical protein Raf01_68590 [Rugosimonospora africana]